MPDLNFEIVGAEAPPFAAVPTLIFKLHIASASAGERIFTVSLRCQIQINVTRRRYSPQAQERLLEIFGEPRRWGETLRPLLWTHASVIVPQFSGSVTADLPITCTYDFEVVSARYFAALEDGEIPLIFLFSGTVFYEGADGNLQVAPISWSKEASYRLPVALWREMIERYYPDSAWIRLHKDVFNRLARYKAMHSFPTWEQTLESLLSRATGASSPPLTGVSPDYTNVNGEETRS